MQSCLYKRVSEQPQVRSISSHQNSHHKLSSRLPPDDKVLLLELPLQDEEQPGQGHGAGQGHQVRLGAGQVDQVALLKPFPADDQPGPGQVVDQGQDGQGVGHDGDQRGVEQGGQEENSCTLWTFIDGINDRRKPKAKKEDNC
jgi:hypothetical protein